MLQQDVLMRQAQQAAQAIAEILMLRQDGQLQEALEVAEGALHLHFEVDPEELHTYSYEHLTERFAFERDEHADRALSFSDLLRHLGELRHGHGQPERAHHPLRLALRLELGLAERRLLGPDPAGRLRTLLRYLPPSEVPEAAFPALIDFFAREHEFARAENWLFHWLNHTDNESVIREKGAAFYDRLTEHSDEELAAGGLPRPEVTEGLRAFEERVAT